MPENGKECESISIDYLFVYKNIYYLQVHLDNSTYKIVDKKSIDYLIDNLFEPDKN